jgi:uncharacterized protein involved in cysteine biosynthesis
MVLGSRRLLALSLLPFLLCLLIYVGIFIAALALTDNVADLVVSPGGWWRTAVRAALMLALPLAFLLAAAFTYTAACLVLAGPLYEYLSAAVERRLKGSAPEEPFRAGRFVADTGRALLLTAVVLLAELAVLLFSLLFVPVTTVLAVMASAVLLAFEMLDYPMGRRRMDIRARLRFARRHFWELLVLGLPMLLALMVPVVGAVFLPLGVVGGTVLFVRLEAGGSRPPEP